MTVDGQPVTRPSHPGSGLIVKTETDGSALVLFFSGESLLVSRPKEDIILGIGNNNLLLSVCGTFSGCQIQN